MKRHKYQASSCQTLWSVTAPVAEAGETQRLQKATLTSGNGWWDLELVLARMKFWDWGQALFLESEVDPWLGLRAWVWFSLNLRLNLVDIYWLDSRKSREASLTVKFSFQILLRNKIYLSHVATTKWEPKLVTLRPDLNTLISPAFWNLRGWGAGAEKRRWCLVNRNSIGLIYRLFCCSLTEGSY